MSLEHAIRLAQANPIESRYKFGAILSSKGRIIGMGLNSYKTHPIQKLYGRNAESIHLHTEIAAIVNAKCDLSDATLHVARVNYKGEPRLAKPCAGCAKAIAAFNIKHVIWSE